MTSLQDILEQLGLVEPETTYADETHGDGRECDKASIPAEFIAQVDGGADLRWVGEIRRRAKLAELKYRDFRSWLRQIDSHLYGAIEETWNRTNIVITDPSPYLRKIKDQLSEENGPELVENCLAYRPFCNMLKEWAAMDLLYETPPLSRLGWLTVMGSPMLWVPREAVELPNWASPNHCHHQFDGNLRKSQESAGRLNATFWNLCDDRHFEKVIQPTEEESLVFCWHPNCARVLLMENAPCRIFDAGHEKAVGLVRDLRSESLKGLVEYYGITLPNGFGQIDNRSSEHSDHLQAADLAAGFAKEEYQRAGIPGVLAKFRAVLYNGKVIR